MSADAAAVPSAPARVVLYSRVGCHLCDDARGVVAEVVGAAGAGWREVDVDEDDELAGRYGDMVPVVEVDGVVQGFWRVDAARLRRALAVLP